MIDSRLDQLNRFQDVLHDVLELVTRDVVGVQFHFFLFETGADFRHVLDDARDHLLQIFGDVSEIASVVLQGLIEQFPVDSQLVVDGLDEQRCGREESTVTTANLKRLIRFVSHGGTEFDQLTFGLLEQRENRSCVLSEFLLLLNVLIESADRTAGFCLQARSKDPSLNCQLDEDVRGRTLGDRAEHLAVSSPTPERSVDRISSLLRWRSSRALPSNAMFLNPRL